MPENFPATSWGCDAGTLVGGVARWGLFIAHKIAEITSDCLQQETLLIKIRVK
jgi:hypothetical protein